MKDNALHCMQYIPGSQLRTRCDPRPVSTTAPSPGPAPHSSPRPAEPPDWRSCRHVTKPRPIAAGQPSLAAGSAPCPAAGDQLAQVEIFGYLPQKFNLKYEMNIVTVASGVTAAGGQTGVLSMNLAIIPSLSWCLDPATSRHTRHTRPARDA